MRIFLEDILAAIEGFLAAAISVGNAAAIHRCADAIEYLRLVMALGPVYVTH